MSGELMAGDWTDGQNVVSAADGLAILTDGIVRANGTGLAGGGLVQECRGGHPRLTAPPACG